MTTTTNYATAAKRLVALMPGYVIIGHAGRWTIHYPDGSELSPRRSSAALAFLADVASYPEDKGGLGMTLDDIVEVTGFVGMPPARNNHRMSCWEYQMLLALARVTHDSLPPIQWPKRRRVGA